MQASTPSIAAISKNQTLNAVAIVVTIAVGSLTLYYLYHQTKLIKMQIDKHEAQKNGTAHKKDV